MRKTKIVGTVGPSSSTPERLDALIAAGLDVARLNFSHGNHEVHRRNCQLVREASERAGRPIGILMDLQGPKIRVGTLEGGSVEIVAGQQLVIDASGTAPRSDGAIGCDHVGLPGDVKPGDPILLDDGKLRLTVDSVEGSRVTTTVEVGGGLGQRKGINLPGSKVSLPALTDKDKRDLKFGVEELKVDWIALSFVQSAADVEEANALSGGLPVIAKIEKPQALDELDAIIRASAGCMVARGDLGVEYPMRRVPIVQKEIIERTNEHGKMVIVATQMLESMIESPVPTRAEVSDVANAVFDGADAVMLSAEMASGSYPIEAVRTMAEIVEEIEGSARFADLPEPTPDAVGATRTNAVAGAAASAARRLEVDTIALFTRTGVLACLLSDHRPRATIVAYTPFKEILGRLALYWGVVPRHAPELFRTSDFLNAFVREDLTHSGLARIGETVVVASPSPPNRDGIGDTMMTILKL